MPIEICPCERCIVLAMCYQKEEIKCEQLYNFVCHVEATCFLGYRAERRDAIYKVFKRYVNRTSFGRHIVVLTKDRNQDNMDMI